jgi:Protein of unknown function (DUF3147)
MAHEWMDLGFRFLVGGVFVSLFAMLGDIVRPKSFAGLFGAAPSVALATLLLTLHRQGARYASIEARSMIIGAVAMLVYASAASRILWRGRTPVPLVAVSGLLLWLCVALGGWLLVLRPLS